MEASMTRVDENKNSKGPQNVKLIMNKQGVRVSSFDLIQYIAPVCPKGMMCPMYIAVESFHFTVTKTRSGLSRGDKTDLASYSPGQILTKLTSPFYGNWRLYSF